MTLDAAQLRRYYLGGTTAFPCPFPSVGPFSVSTADLSYGHGTQHETTLVAVHEKRGPGQLLTRTIAKDHVRAIFVPGTSQYDPHGTETGFTLADPNAPVDFEKGKWFLTPDIGEGHIATALHVDPTRIRTIGTSPVHGIVFVPEHAPVYSRFEASQPAAEAAELAWPTCQGDLVPTCQGGYVLKCQGG